MKTLNSDFISLQTPQASSIHSGQWLKLGLNLYQVVAIDKRNFQKGSFKTLLLSEDGLRLPNLEKDIWTTVKVSELQNECT